MFRKVLVVEDDDLLRQLTAEMLSECGLEVLQVESGDHALGVVSRDAASIDVVVTDVRMPGKMDGLDLAKTIVARWPHIRVLVVSGFSPDMEGRLPDGVAFMSKPWLPLEVIKFVTREP